MDQLLRFLHSWTRWGVVITAVVVIVWMLMGLLQKRPYDKRGNLLMTIFTSLIDTQWLIGIFLLGAWGGKVGFGSRHFWEHAALMTIALVIAHTPVAWKRKEIADSVRYRNNLLVVVATLAVIFIGVSMLPSGIQWRFVGV